MTSDDSPQKRFRTTGVAAAVGALVVFALLLPMRGNDSDPPECFSALGYVVPCGLGPEQSHGAGFALAGAALAAALVGVGSFAGRRERLAAREDADLRPPRTGGRGQE